MKILLCPLASPGFVYPMVGLARELERRGHEVRFATDLSYATQLRELGLERLPRSDPDGDSFQLSMWAHPFAVAIQSKHIQYALQRFPADLLITSTLALGPLLVGEIYQIDTVVLGLTPYLWPILDHVSGQLRSADNEATWRHREFVRFLDTARHLVNMPPCDASLDHGSLLGSLYLLQTVAPFEPLAGLLPQGVALVGSCVWNPDASEPTLQSWLAHSAGTPLVYLQHGSVFNGGQFWETFIGAVEGLPIRAAASLGRLRGGPPPAVSDQFFTRSHLFQEPVLQRASAVVASGNSTAVLGALTHGLPMVLLPGGGEQHVLAQRCAAAGVALVLPPATAGPADLRVALLRVLHDPGFRDRARTLQQAFRDAGGRFTAVDAIERRWSRAAVEVA
jgi:UDP:flavonoid glycosyltransferase YjiC (YdhE family)